MVSPLIVKVIGVKYTKFILLKSLKKQLALFLKSKDVIKFQKPIAPKVSVIIPVYNGAHHTLRCLRALANDQSVEFEVIVFDDGSSDETTTLLNRCENLIVLKSAKNGGSIKAVNQAAAQARGEFILLLNNDATIQSGNLADALTTFRSEQNVGAVGARIKQADGRLQEAGCMIYQDGITNGYLRFCKADDPRAMYMRDVDYCSAMYLLMRRDEFLNLGGLDEIYAPAYFEETDLCMKLRAKGLRVIYDPTILVEHFEFGSHNPKSGRKLIAERRTIFLGRWQKHLKQEGYSLSEDADPIFRSATRLVARPRILFVCDETKPENFSAELCAVIRLALAKNFHISLLLPSLASVQWTKFYALFGKKIELVVGSSPAQILALLEQRPAYFDFCVGFGSNGEKNIATVKSKKDRASSKPEFLSRQEMGGLDQFFGSAP